MSHIVGYFVLPIALAVLLTGCHSPPASRYELRGRVVAVDSEARVVTIAHEAIPGFMGAMTMPFRVNDPSLVANLAAGDVIAGRLVVAGQDGFLETIQLTDPRTLAEEQSSPAAAIADLLLEGDSIPDVTLTDQDGRPRQLLARPPQAVVVTFVYTRCPFPDFCPLVDRHFNTLQQTILTDSQLRGRVQLLSITLDPGHDTPAVLKKHAETLGASPAIWSFVRVDEPNRDDLAARFGVSTSRNTGHAGAIVHGLVTVLINPAGVIARIIRGSDWAPTDAINLLRSMLSDPA